jgi:hypothetical protein
MNDFSEEQIERELEKIKTLNFDQLEIPLRVLRKFDKLKFRKALSTMSKRK